MSAARSVGRPTGPSRDYLARRTAIVAAASEVFATRGYGVASFQAIADEVGMSQSSLFHYFPTKRALLVAVLEQRDDQRGMRGDRRHADTYVEAAVRLARANTEVPGVIELYTVLAGESVTSGHPARDYFASRFTALRTEIAADLRHLQSLGQLRDGVDPERAAASLMALWDGIQLQWLLDRSVDMAGCLRDFLEGILRTTGDGQVAWPAGPT